MDAVVIVIVDEHVGVQLVALNETVAPDGSPDAEKLTPCVVPEVSVAVAVVDTELPCVAEPAPDDKDAVKSKAPPDG